MNRYDMALGKKIEKEPEIPQVINPKFMSELMSSIPSQQPITLELMPFRDTATEIFFREWQRRATGLPDHNHRIYPL